MMTNIERARSVDKAIRQFAIDMGLDLPDEGPSVTAGDMICNILHWVQERTQDDQEAVLQVARSGIGHYITESLIDYTQDNVDEVGPESTIDIIAYCDGQNFST